MKMGAMNYSFLLKKGFNVILFVLLLAVTAGCGAGGADGVIASSGGSGTTSGGTTSGGGSTGGGSTGGGTTGGGSSTVTYSASLSWSPTTANIDGTPIGSDLAGYKVYYGTSSGNYLDYVTLGSDTTNVVINQLPSGTYYFTVTAFDTAGNESAFSNEAVKSL